MGYEEEYKKTVNSCGDPFPEIVKFFEEYEKENAAVLDLGCGQGRDAIFAASKGHYVTGVDISPTGISQMVEAGKKRHLQIEGIVADVVKFTTRKRFDIILLDRVLHMLPSDHEKKLVLERAASYLRKDGYILIADTPMNQKLITDFFISPALRWKPLKTKKGFHFLNRCT